MQERREFQRRRTLLGGRIAFNNRYSTLDCLVRNMSQNGAMVVFEDSVVVPNEFDLIIPQKGESRRARIVWRWENETGIAFPQAAGAQGVISIETARRIKALEAERAALQARVVALSAPM
jgi:hypothetical protein